MLGIKYPIIMAPMFVLALMIRKYFVQGMTMGAVR